MTDADVAPETAAHTPAAESAPSVLPVPPVLAVPPVPPVHVRLAVLGPITVELDGVIVRPRASRQRRLLAVLAATGRDAIGGVEEMVDALYGSDAPRSARHSLATELWRVRQLLGADAVTTESNGYRIDPDRCEVDAIRFEAMVAAGRAALRRGDFDDAQLQLAGAQELWRGEPLAELRDHPLGRAAIARLTELRLGGVEDHAEVLLALGRHPAAAELLERLTIAEPAREHAWALLVESCLAAGHRRRARTVFDAARRTLAEYGVDLGAELRAVSQRLDAEPQNDASSTPPARPVSILPGRDTDLAAVLGAVEAGLERRRPSAVVVTGEAGIGKTALVTAALDQLVDVTVGRIDCDHRLQLPLAACRPLIGHLSELSGTVSPMVTTLLEHDATDYAGRHAVDVELDPLSTSRTALVDAVADLIERAASHTRRLVVLVEDAHWATPTALEILSAVIARRAELPICFLVTVRSVDAMAPAELTEIRRRAARVITLTGLDEAAVAQLLGSSTDLDDVRHVRALTGGNPLYLRELVRLEQTSPLAGYGSTLADALDERLAGLTPEVIDILELVSVAGSRVDARVVTAAADSLPAQVADALDVAGQAGLLTGFGTANHHVNFVHALIRDHLYHRIETSRRREWHIRVARASERVLTGDGPSVELIAHHYANGWPACPTDVAVASLRRAGDQAGAQLGFDLAHSYYRRALDIIAMDPAYTDASTTADLLYAAAQAAVAAIHDRDVVATGKDLEPARDTLLALHRFAVREDLPDARLRASLALVRSYSHERIDPGALDRLTADLRDGFADTGDWEGRWNHPGSVIAESVAELCARRPEAAHAVIDDATRVAPDASGALLTAVWQKEQAAARLATARRLVADDTADPVAAWVRLWASEVTAGLRGLDDAPPRPRSDVEPSPAAAWEAVTWQTAAAIASGRFVRAQRMLDAAQDHIRHGATNAEIAKRAAARMGQQVRLTLLSADKPIRSDELAVPNSTWVTHPVMRPWHAYVAAATGEFEVARRACENLTDDFDDGVVLAADELPWAASAAFAAVAVGHVRCMEVCREILSGYSGMHATFYLTAYLGSVDMHLGRLAVAVDDLDGGIDLLEHAVDQHERAGARSYLAHSHQALATALYRRNRTTDRASADQQRGLAVGLADSLGMGALANLAWPRPA